MGLPSWFQSASEQRLDQVMVWIKRQSELCKLCVEERTVFNNQYEPLKTLTKRGIAIQAKKGT